MNTKNISWDKVSFKMAENYEEFSVSLLNLNYSYEDDDFLAFAELHGDLDIVGYAIIWGSNNEAKDIILLTDILGILVGLFLNIICKVIDNTKIIN